MQVRNYRQITKRDIDQGKHVIMGIQHTTKVVFPTMGKGGLLKK